MPGEPPAQCPTAPVALEAEGIAAGYDEVSVLHDVSVRAEAGQVVALVGPNGAGKSTLLRVLSGTLAPSRGAVRLGGAPMTSLSRREIARRVAVCPQEVDVAFGFTVRDVVMMGRAPHQGRLLLATDEDQAAVDEALRTCDLESLADRPVDRLSGGERRRVALGRAIAQRARVLLLDEPAAHLDVRHSVLVFERVRDLVATRGTACLAVVHDLNAAARWADRAVLLAQGRVRAHGVAADVLRPSNLEPAFGVRLLAVPADDGSTVLVPRSTGDAVARPS